MGGQSGPPNIRLSPAGLKLEGLARKARTFLDPERLSVSTAASRGAASFWSAARGAAVRALA